MRSVSQVRRWRPWLAWGLLGACVVPAGLRAETIVLTGNVTIAEGDLTYDHQTIVQQGGTLTVMGPHTFENLTLTNGAVLTHPAFTTNATYHLELNVAGVMLISTNSSINVTGHGYPAGWTHPETTNGASTGYSGGSYGGLGGAYSGPPNAIYGDYRDPNELGSGSGTSVGGGPGGGLVRIVAGELVLEGTILASASNMRYGAGSGGGVLVGLVIMAMQRRSSLASDTIIGVVFAAVMAFGLAIVSRDRGVARDLQRFLYGDILTVTGFDLAALGVLFVGVMAFQAWGYNRLLYIGLHPVLAQSHGVRVVFYQYAFAGLLALVVMFSVWAVGVLLVTALLVVPAAAARNFARSAGPMFWWAMLVSISSAIAGLLISAQDWAATATGPTIVLCGFAWFLVSQIIVRVRRRSM